VETFQMAHGIIMGATVVVLFPFGAIFMRLGGAAIPHGIIQMFSLCALIAGFGLGVVLAQKTSLLFNNSHTIFGTVIFALFLIQPVFGVVHHLMYRKSGNRNLVSHFHIWYGRVIMALAIINGGLGLKLAANSKNGEIAYGVIAGVVGVVYIAAFALRRKGSRKNAIVDERKTRDTSS